MLPIKARGKKRDTDDWMRVLHGMRYDQRFGPVPIEDINTGRKRIKAVTGPSGSRDMM